MKKKSMYNADILAAAAMLDVSDEKIRSWSNGAVVNSFFDAVEDGKVKESMIDREIFGQPGTMSGDMGHVELPAPVVNIQYLYGAKPVLPQMLGMEQADLADIVYCSRYIVTDPKGSGFSSWQVIVEKEVLEHPDIEAKTGAEAVLELLKKNGIPSDNYVLNCVPVLPLDLRTVYENKKFYAFSTQRLYDYIIVRSARFKRLIDLGAPDVILNTEQVLLQRAVDSLINNGVREMPFTMNDGTASVSLEELFHMLSDSAYRPRKMVLPDTDPVDENLFADLQKQYLQELERSVAEAAIDLEDLEDISTLNDEMEDLEEERLMKEMQDLLLPLIEAVIDKNFPEYKEKYHAEMVQSALETGLDFERYDPEKGAMAFYAPGIFSRINNYIQKRRYLKQES